MFGNKNKVLSDTEVECALCFGTGVDKTGLSRNGTPYYVCPRCGGYGSFDARCDNSPHITEQDKIYLGLQKELIPKLSRSLVIKDPAILQGSRDDH